ncbi:MAG: TIGR03936 family radical SAM-associated protein [Actinobacteria bacterium]|nr:TIGR03936 family radical SAM-associated protein [Actinomycetota bacterium]
MNFNYQMRFSKTGRARFISHLDTLSCLVRAIRRTGFELAFSQGMRPKPVLSLAMPLGVGVEGEDEICDFSLRQRAPLTDLAKKLSRELPQGMELKSVGPSFDRSKAASRVESCGYRVELDDAAGEHPDAAAEYGEAAGKYNGASELVLLRKRPKGDKEVDIKKYVDRIDLLEDGRGVAFDMKVTSEGTARPDEIVRALGSFAGRELKASRIVRTSITVREEEQPRAPGPGRPGPGRYGPPRGRRR